MTNTTSYDCHAEIIGCSSDSASGQVQALRRMPGVEVIDTLAAQVADLLRTRSPGRTLDGDVIQQATDAFFRDNGGERYGVWVWYPWTRRLVRLLARADFVELRTSRNQHKITADEQASLSTRTIGVIGLSVGQSVALTLALERSCGELRLADFDTVDLSNLNRLRCGLHDLGLPKTVVAAREIAEIDPFLRVTCFHDGYTEANADAFMDGLDVVVDECDSLDVKVKLRVSARARGIPVLMSTSDRGMVDIERFDAEPDRPVFHGRLDGIHTDDLAGLSTEEKVPILMDLAGLPSASVRLRMSLLEIGESIKTWPQLASDVGFGGAAICDVARRLLLGEPVASGCYYTDFTDIGDPARALPVRPRAASRDVMPAADAPAAGAPAADAVDGIIADAGFAPSAGNAQPWLWTRTTSGLELSQRHIEHASPLYQDNKVSLVALGAALETAIISARSRGFRVDVDTAPASGHIASLTLARDVTVGEDPLYRQIHRRRSVRTRPAQVGELPASSLDVLRHEVSTFPGLRLHCLQSRADIEEAAQLAGDAERLRILDPASHADLVNELCWTDAEHARRREGIPLSSLAISAAEKAGLEIIRDRDVLSGLAQWDLGAGMRKLSYEQMLSSSAVCLLWSDTDTPADYLAGGRALQRLWLAATAADIGLCPITSCCYLLNAWRSGARLTGLQSRGLPALETRYRTLFGLPVTRGDIALLRLLPARTELARPAATLRLPMTRIAA